MYERVKKISIVTVAGAVPVGSCAVFAGAGRGWW